jgi:hypothetical protein
MNKTPQQRRSQAGKRARENRAKMDAAREAAKASQNVPREQGARS